MIWLDILQKEFVNQVSDYKLALLITVSCPNITSPGSTKPFFRSELAVYSLSYCRSS